MATDPARRPPANEELITPIRTANVTALIESDLEQHAACVHSRWDAIRLAGPHSDQELRDENETHRLDCYIQPTYHIERPTPLVGLGGDLHSGRDSMDSLDDDSQSTDLEATVEPRDDDESLLNFLATSVWDGAPAWLVDAQKVGPRWLAVYDNAGVGKTVFTFRAAHVATSAAVRKRLFRDRAPLVVRWVGRWPRHGKEFLSLHEALARQVCSDLGWHTDDPTKYENARCDVQHALDQRRVMVILDGFDQFSLEDRDHVAQMLRHTPGGIRTPCTAVGSSPAGFTPSTN